MNKVMKSVLAVSAVLLGMVVVVWFPPFSVAGYSSAQVSLVAECQAQVNAVDNCVREKIWNAYPQGWAVRTISKARLSESEHRIYLMTFYKEHQYQILACGDKSMKNVDLVLYDADGRLVVQEDTQDRQPAINFQPTETDTYYLAVHAMERVQAKKGPTAEKGIVAVAVTYR